MFLILPIYPTVECFVLQTQFITVLHQQPNPTLPTFLHWGLDIECEEVFNFISCKNGRGDLFQ